MLFSKYKNLLYIKSFIKIKIKKCYIFMDYNISPLCNVLIGASCFAFSKAQNYF